jgi:hypothetical protein
MASTNLEIIQYDPMAPKKKRKPANSMPSAAQAPAPPALPPSIHLPAQNPLVEIQNTVGSQSTPTAAPEPPVAVQTSITAVPVPPHPVENPGNNSAVPPVEVPATSLQPPPNNSHEPSPTLEDEHLDHEDENENENDWEDEEDEADAEDRIPAGKPGVSTWRERNPGRHVIPLRTQRKKQTAETRATAKLKRAATMKKAQDLQADIDAINLARNKMAEEIAVKHNVKVDFVLRRLMAQSSFRAVRKVNLFNAKVHRICKKARSGKWILFIGVQILTVS